jgi:UDP-N-acetylmuramoylalanine--D-glutamate ligase
LINVNGKQVAVLGLGRSGYAAAKLLVLHGAQVVIVDDKSPEKLQAWIEKAQGLSRTRLVLGGGGRAEISSSDLVVISPGVSLNHPLQEEAREKGIPVVGELELAYGYCAATVAAITGTNGKTTTTTLLAEMIRSGGRKALSYF